MVSDGWFLSGVLREGRDCDVGVLREGSEVFEGGTNPHTDMVAWTVFGK